MAQLEFVIGMWGYAWDMKLDEDVAYVFFHNVVMCEDCEL